MPDKWELSGKVQEWFILGESDSRTAQIAFNGGAPTRSIAILIQQAVEKYLKGYLISRGWKLKKTHDLEVLISEAISQDKGFEQFLDIARTVSAYYLLDRYPPLAIAEYPREEILDMLEQSERLIAKIKESMA